MTLASAILLCSVSLSNLAWAAPCPQFSFASAGTFRAGSQPVSVAVADFNGDGKPDLVVANQVSGDVSVLLGNGNGTFQTAVNYASGNGPSSVAVGDFNGDGKRDLAIANSGSGDVSVLLGNGDGTFQAFVSYGLGDVPQSVAVGDFNGDGKLDLAVAMRTFADVSVLLGNGDGTFQAAQYYGAGADPLSVAVGDFTGDGKLDLAVGNAGLFDAPPNVSVLLATNDNKGFIFQPAVNYDAGSSPRSVAVADFNGDGKLDLVVANYGALDNDGRFTGSSVSVLLGNGDGTFQAAVNYSAQEGPLSTAVGDFNGDGKPDLAVANDLSASVSVLLGNGDGTFQASMNYGAGTNPRSVAVADFNGDLRPDVAVVNADGVTVLLNICLNNPPTISGIADQVINEDTSTTAISFTVGDMETNPGLLSVAGASSNTNLVNNANFAFGGSGANRTVTITPLPNRSGITTNTITVSDGATTASTTFVLTVNPVNDPPSFVKGANQTVLEDAGSQTVSGWATAISAGPTDEGGQSLTFLVSNNNTALFSVQPTVSLSGTLTYTPAPNANGTATVTVQLQDNGGTANGGIDISAPQTFTITVTAVNDPPSFVKGANQTVAEDSGPQTVIGWATGISAGPANESGQSLTFLVSDNNTGLFVTQPAVSASGTLTYTS
ncbi:MAG: hypothetical protein DME26_21920, partial [Verrucomicrobia bacterium]